MITEAQAWADLSLMVYMLISIVPTCKACFRFGGWITAKIINRYKSTVD